jgi:hypothetical protein
MLHGWTNRTLRARNGDSGALGGTDCFCAFASRFLTFLYDGLRDFRLSCDTGRIWIMSSLGGLRNIWYWFVFRTAFDGSIFSESAYYLFPLPDLLS